MAPHVVSSGEVAILPNDVGGLRSILESELLAEELFHTQVVHCDLFRIIRLESDEGRCGDGQFFKIHHDSLNIIVFFAHAVEVVGGNFLSTSAKCENELRVVESEDDVSDFGLGFF